MKKNIGCISLDAALAEWLQEKLRLSAPDTESANELREGLEDLLNNQVSALMLELDEHQPSITSTTISCDGLTIDPRLRKVVRDGVELALTPK